MISYRKLPLTFDIVDVHAHYGQFNIFNTPGCDADGLIKIMDRTGIRQMCIAPFIGLKEDPVLGNNLTAEAMRAYPDRILGHACINPYNPEEAAGELERCFEKLGFHAIKLHPDFNGLDSGSSAYDLVFEYAQGHNLTILWHYGASASHIEKLAARYDRVKFVLAHYGGAWNGYSDDPVLRLVKEVDNIYTDTASSVVFYGTFERLVEYVGDDKILFGSDAVFLDPAYQLGRVSGSDIPAGSKEKILGGNFKRLLALRSTENITSDSFLGNGVPSVVPRKRLSEVIFSPVLKTQ